MISSKVFTLDYLLVCLFIQLKLQFTSRHYQGPASSSSLFWRCYAGIGITVFQLSRWFASSRSSPISYVTSIRCWRMSRYKKVDWRVEWNISKQCHNITLRHSINALIVDLQKSVAGFKRSFFNSGAYNRKYNCRSGWSHSFMLALKNVQAAFKMLKIENLPWGKMFLM